MTMPIIGLGALSEPAFWAIDALGGFTIAVLAVLLLRRPLRSFSGPRVAYGLWLLPPGAVLATLGFTLAPAASLMRRGIHLGTFVVTPAAPATLTRVPNSMVTSLLGVWLAGCALSLLILTGRYMSLRRGMQPVPDALRTPQGPYRDVARKLRVYLHPAGPALLWSPRRPLLLLPADFTRRYSRIQQNHVLHHELCHYAQGDPWWNLLAALLSTVFWFHPLLPWARRCFLVDQELACDALLLHRSHAAPRAYADTLLLAATGTALPLASSVANPRQLKERIAMLAQARRSPPRRLAGACFVLILLGGAVLAAPSVQPLPARSSITTRSATQIVHYNEHRPPQYPLAAAKDQAQGTVYLAVLVGTQGLPLAIRQLHEPGPQPAQSLINASLRAVAQWHFDPAMRDGKAVAGWVKVPIEFKLWKKTGKPGSSEPTA